MPVLTLSFDSGESSIEVRRFRVHERLSGLFEVDIEAVSPNADLDLDTIVGKGASFHIESGLKFAHNGVRMWKGVCNHIEQVQAETTGLSTYHLRIVPTQWLLSQRQGYRIFQHQAIPDIVDKILGEWSIVPVWQIDRAQCPKLEYKVQYGESDHAFLCRLLEEAGIAYLYPVSAAGAQLTFNDKLDQGTPRVPDLPFVDAPNAAAEKEYVTEVVLVHEVRPGAYTIRDYDFRNSAFPLFGDAPKANPPEDFYEQYHYQPGAFLTEGGKAGDTPVADDKGVARYDQKFGSGRAQRALIGIRADKRVVNFATNALDLAPGVVFTIDNHPHAELTGKKLLVSDVTLDGGFGIEWHQHATAVLADTPYRPRLETPKPEVTGVQSAVVVGGASKEIDPDEFGRVKVQFPWDREGKNDDSSSCWMRVSQGWAGTGFGLITIPRVGQEVLVGFLTGDPDQPIIVGRLFNNKNPVPYKLPENKTRSTWKSNTSLGGGGFNEIMFEDLAGSELLWMQAQRNLRKLVKNDETITVGNNRQKLVKSNETELTGATRTEVTGGDRVEITGNNRTTAIGATHSKLVKGDEIERTEGDHLVRIGREQHLIVKKVKRELVAKDSHLKVNGSRNIAVGSQSLIVGKDQNEKVGGKHALEALESIHFKAGTDLVMEAVSTLTIKGPGGFIFIDASGVTIQGTVVKINCGGSAGSAPDAKPGGPEDPKEAKIDEPQKPVPDDVSKTGIAQ